MKVHTVCAVIAAVIGFSVEGETKQWSCIPSCPGFLCLPPAFEALLQRIQTRTPCTLQESPIYEDSSESEEQIEDIIENSAEEEEDVGLHPISDSSENDSIDDDQSNEDDSIEENEPQASEYESVENSVTFLAAFVCSAPGIFPDPDNCQNYYTCSPNLSSYLYTCPSGTYFDTKSQKCSATKPASCTTTTTTAKPTSTTPKPTTTTPKPTTTTAKPTTTTAMTTTSSTTASTTTTTSSAGSTAAPVECTKSGKFPDKSNCQNFYTCSEDLTIHFYTCPGETYFDPGTLLCTTTKPDSCSGATTETTTPSGTTADTAEGTTPTDTTEDTTTEASTTEASTPDTTEASTIDTTEDTTSADTTTASPGFECTTSGTFADPDNCKNFYTCSENLTVHLYTCPGGNYFDPTAKLCSTVKPSTCGSAK